jgi:hypothetical protein
LQASRAGSISGATGRPPLPRVEEMADRALAAFIIIQVQCCVSKRMIPSSCTTSPFTHASWELLYGGRLMITGTAENVAAVEALLPAGGSQCTYA